MKKKNAFFWVGFNAISAVFFVAGALASLGGDKAAGRELLLLGYASAMYAHLIFGPDERCNCND